MGVVGAWDLCGGGWEEQAKCGNKVGMFLRWEALEDVHPVYSRLRLGPEPILWKDCVDEMRLCDILYIS